MLIYFEKQKKRNKEETLNEENLEKSMEEARLVIKKEFALMKAKDLVGFGQRNSNELLLNVFETIIDYSIYVDGRLSKKLLGRLEKIHKTACSLRNCGGCNEIYDEGYCPECQKEFNSLEIDELSIMELVGKRNRLLKSSIPLRQIYFKAKDLNQAFFSRL